ncbi:hypothetical protein EWM64_g5562 [Hericium alpestre]|uniref:Uncharacterized protein n=1 Tax=Hericium alpestre TaxID=135208 RepID=A0A4Y9ZUH5_9AGAM|nr:hypothetical protein EWM64_g5562 [Hericium alpestre]
MDSNFESTGSKMWRPANDVQLSEGAGFMVGQEEYKKHLKVANDQHEFLPYEVDTANYGIPLSAGDGEQFDRIREEDKDDDTQHTAARCRSGGYIPIERMAISLPSCLDEDVVGVPQMKPLVEAELELREGQANDALQSLRLALRYKAYVFRTDVQNANSQRKKMQAWDDVSSIESTVQHQAHVYSRCREAMEDLGAKKDMLKRFQLLLPEHLKVRTAVLDPSVRGLRNSTLPWFWTMDISGDSLEGEWLADFH